MYKKLLCVIALCLLSISSICYANSTELEEISLYLGETINLDIYFSTKNISIPLDHNTIIQVADTNILSVDETFNLQTSSIGEGVIVIVNNDNFTTLTVKVKSPNKEITYSDDDLVLLLGEIYPLNYQVIGQDDYYKPINQRLKWTSNKANVIGIKGGNQIYTHAVGTTTLTGTTYDGELSISIDVTVIGNPDKLTIKPDIINTSIKVGEPRQLNAFFGTKDVTSNVRWDSQYPDMVRVDDNGLVTPLHEGTCTITAISSIDREDSYTFFVKSMVDKITLDSNSIIIDKIGDQKKLNATLTYKNADEEPLLNGYYYESSNPLIATVTQEGLVTSKRKGIALISAIAFDSGKKDVCTVEVIGETTPTTINYTPVDEVILSPYNYPIIVGEKIFLEYELYPKDATEQSVRFDIRNGDVNQIQNINGHYYFIPNERGDVDIKIIADNNATDLIEVSVSSQIGKLELDLDNDRGTTNEKRLYIGEQSEITTDMITQGHYTNFDVYPNILKYTVDDSDVLKLENFGGKYYVTALKKGSTTIRVENIEGKYQDSIKVRVSSPTSKISTNREVRLPIDIFYTPEVNYTPSSSVSSDETFNIYNALEIEVDEFYFEEAYIDKEIAYEEQLLINFRTAPYSSSTDSNITRHNMRLERLLRLKNSASGGYCLVNNNFLKDRNFESYRYYTINDNKIMGHYPGKSKVIISIEGTATKDTTLLYWNTNFSKFEVKATNEWIDYNNLIAEKSFYSALSTLGTQKQVELAIYYESNKYNFSSIPSIELLSALSTLEGDKLPTSLFNNFNNQTTKEELAYTAMYLDAKYKASNKPKTNNIIFYDVLDINVKQALALGYIIPDSQNYLGVTSYITYAEFKEVIDKILPSNTLPASSDNVLTHEELILLINQL